MTSLVVAKNLPPLERYVEAVFAQNPKLTPDKKTRVEELGRQYLEAAKFECEKPITLDSLEIVIKNLLELRQTWGPNFTKNKLREWRRYADTPGYDDNQSIATFVMFVVLDFHGQELAAYIRDRILGLNLEGMTVWDFICEYPLFMK